MVCSVGSGRKELGRQRSSSSGRAAFAGCGIYGAAVETSR